MIKASFSILFALLLFAESMVPQKECSQLTKLPSLIKHFNEHQVENSAITFIDFLKMHYDDQKHHGDDHETHHSLPLCHHNHHHCCYHFLALTTPLIHTFHSLRPSATIVADNYQDPSTSSFLVSIWQPPKFI